MGFPRRLFAFRRIPVLNWQGWQPEHGWKHGPHALVAMRNEVVHPSPKYGRLSPRAYYEAWNLGQWYLELMLLRLCEASGEYGNRLTQKWVGEVEHLGQWLVENMPRGAQCQRLSCSG